MEVEAAGAPSRLTTSEKSLLPDLSLGLCVKGLAAELPTAVPRRPSFDFLGTSRFRGACESRRGASGDGAIVEVDVEGDCAAQGAIADRGEVGEVGSVKSAEVPAAEGVAEMSRMEGTAWGGDDIVGDEDEAFVAWGRDKSGSVLRILSLMSFSELRTFVKVDVVYQSRLKAM